MPLLKMVSQTVVLVAGEDHRSCCSGSGLLLYLILFHLHTSFVTAILVNDLIFSTFLVLNFPELCALASYSIKILCPVATIVAALGK